MKCKKIIVPKGENPIKFLKEEDISDAIVYFDSKLLKRVKKIGKVINGCYELNDTVTFLVDDEVLVFTTAYGELYHKLIRLGVISYNTIRHDKRQKIIFFVGE